eukprot:6619717-Lingulodinium_polyedra.AAC.1
MAFRESLARRLTGAGPQESPASAAVLITVVGQRGAPLMPQSTVMAPSMQEGAQPVVRPVRA